MPFRVQGYDIDFARIVSNIVYVRWLEDLRLRFCDRHYPLEEMIAQDFVPVLSSTQIEYKRAIRFGDEVLGRIWFVEFQGPRWIFQCELLVNGELSATAIQTGAFVRLTTSRPIKVPRDLAERFQVGGSFTEPEST
ncbi:acyl-CoA thioesterase [Singulisphaera sp. PoT]|uniref:acyl-CoA thioesterase n=1 Tax=Singulisphaera sp. PoT TaxID=3411797 RepID=UPI003BF5203C